MSKPTLDSARIGREIARLRKQLNMSSTELGRRVGLSQPQISRLENGKQGFRSDTLARIAEALGVTPAYFFIDEADDVQQEQARAHETRNRMGAQLAQDIEQQYGEIAVTPAFKQSLKRLAVTLNKDETNAKTLRKLLDRIFAMTNEDREALLGNLGHSRRRNGRSARKAPPPSTS